MRSAILGAALLLAGVTEAVAAAADAIRAGDMDGMIPEIIAVYEDAGLSWDHRIEWRVGPFTTTFWYYSTFEDAIIAGAVPTAAQVDAYWQTWSEVLTDGNFAPDTFFASAADAEELARYNQFVLATHEAAHAMTYRYDYAHLERHDDAINCREYYADRLTVAILNDEAARDPDMARWRARYLDLVTAMGETIPEQYRYHIADFATLDANCAVIDVAQPTPETMQPYASAYFERYRVLLDAKLPPLPEVLATHLTRRWEAARGNVPFAPDRDSFELVTVGDRAEIELGRTFFGLDDESDVRSRAAAIAPDGDLWFATLTYKVSARTAALAFGTDPEASPPAGEPISWHRASERLELTSLAVLSADRFIVALDHYELEGVDKTERHFVTWLLATRTGGDWSFDSLAEVPDMGQGVALRSPTGRIYLLGTVDAPSRDPSANWRGLEVSLQTGEVLAEITVTSPFVFPMAIDAEGRMYEQLNYMLWRSTPGAGDDVLIGTGLIGPRDGAGAVADLSDLIAMQWMADGSAMLIARGLTYDRWVQRNLRPRSTAK